MYCPKCRTENPDDAQSCHSCGQDFAGISSSARAPNAETNDLAIAALVLGILSITPLTFIVGIPAIIFGIVALVKIKRSGGRLKGRGLAIAGIIIPIVSFSALFLLFDFSVILSYKVPSYKVKQKARFHAIEVALEIFNHEFNGYPPSEAFDEANQPYCGAMKLCEAIMGQDLMGFHPDSVFRADGMDSGGQRNLYPVPANSNNVKARKGPYLPIKNANVYRLKDLYKNTDPFDPNNFVLCDVYRHVIHKGTGKIIGMPILYYKANTLKTAHDIENPDNPENIYNYKDNQTLVGLGVPGKPKKKHPLYANPKIFYEMIKNYKVTTQSTHKMADSFILISAGYDGLYGTQDDILNSGRGWKPK